MLDLDSLLSQKESLKLAFDQALEKDDFSIVKDIYLQLKEVEKQISLLQAKINKDEPPRSNTSID